MSVELGVDQADLSLGDSGRILVFCHGSTSRNGQAGVTAAFACVFPDFPHHDTVQRGDGKATNIRTYYLAALEAMRVADEIDATRTRPLEIVSNSENLVKTMTEWVEGWAKNKWRRRNNKPIENDDLVKKMYEGCQQRKSVVWTKVPGEVEGLDPQRVDWYQAQAENRAKAKARSTRGRP